MQLPDRGPDPAVVPPSLVHIDGHRPEPGQPLGLLAADRPGRLKSSSLGDRDEHAQVT